MSWSSAIAEHSVQVCHACGASRRCRSKTAREICASSRRTSRRRPATRSIFMWSYLVVWWRIHAITAACARSSIGMRCVRATVPLPTGAACSVIARATACATGRWSSANAKNAKIAAPKSKTYPGEAEGNLQ